MRFGAAFGVKTETEDAMDVTGAAQVQILFGIAAQKGAIEVQANAVNKLLENISVESPQSSRAGAGLCADASADCGVGTQVNIVV